MERAIFLPLLLMAAPASAQSILLSGFENVGVFDLTGVYTYCSLAAIQGSNDTPGGGSIWSAAIPADFGNTCAQPAITQGLFFALPGLSQGENVDISFQHKVPVNGALSMNVLYVNPAGDPLPVSEWDLGFPEIGFYETGVGTWSSFAGSFDVPMIMPWPSDLYLVIRYMPGAGSTAPALIDNVSLGEEISTGVNNTDHALSTLQIIPVPAADHITVTGLDSRGGDINIFDLAGIRVASTTSTTDRATFDMSRSAPGMYVLKQGARSARFIKE